MVTLVDRRRVVLAALLFVLGVTGLGLYARAFAPVLSEALVTSLEAATDHLVQLGWAQVVAATDRRSFVRNCAFLNREGCARRFRRKVGNGDEMDAGCSGNLGKVHRAELACPDEPDPDGLAGCCALLELGV